MKPKAQVKAGLRDKGESKYVPYYAAAVLFLTLLLFSSVSSFSFLSWDDPKFVMNNNLVTSLSFKNIQNMFTGYIAGNYCPLTILSYALDYHFAGGFSPKYFHSISLIFHLLNTFLVFVFIYRLSGKQVLVAGIASLLFGIHPMHVESVAWVAERRDLLYAMFYLLGLIAYLKYLRGERQIKYFVYTLLFFLGSLFSKGQAVTFPLVLVIIDYIHQRKMDFKSIAEKIPFFSLSLVFGYVAVVAQGTTDATTVIHLSLFDKIVTGNYGLMLYLIKVFVPFNLSGMHPYPASFSLLARISPLVIICLVILIWIKLKSDRAIIGGLMFFLLSIFPVLQFFPVGNAMIAERYTYIPYIGLFFIVGYVYQKIRKSEWLKVIKPYAGTILITFFTLLCFVTIGRVKAYSDTISYWSDVLRHYPDSKVALNNRAITFISQNQYDLALIDFNAAIKSDSNDAASYANRGALYAGSLRQLDLGIRDFTHALSLDPGNQEVLRNIGVSYYQNGDFDNAISQYNKLIVLNPTDGKTFYYRGNAWSAKKDYAKALSDIKKAKELGFKVDEALIRQFEQLVH